MSASSQPNRLDVAAAIERGVLRGTVAEHRAAENPSIDSVVLVTHPEQVRRVGPRAAVVIAAGTESSGWLVTSILRYAWERRASLVVAAGVQPESVVALARRLNVTLLSTMADPAKTALDLAAEIGAAEAALDSQLVAVLRVVAREQTLEGILRTAGAELGVALDLTFRRASIASSGDPDCENPERDGPFVVSDTAGDLVELWVYGSRSRAAADRSGRPLAEAALPLILPALRAAWLDLDAADGVGSLSAVAAATRFAVPRVLTELGWQDQEGHLVIYLLAPTPSYSSTLSRVVRLVWRAATGHGGLSEAENGWVAVRPAAEEDGAGRLSATLARGLPSALADLGVRVGVSSIAVSAGELPQLVTEARIAARCAWSLGRGEVASFETLQLSAVDYLFDAEDARMIAALSLPEFCAAPDVDKLVESVKAFVDEGSVSAAATSLSVHRNTVTARLDRARSLGLPVGEPRLVVAVAAVVRALASESTIGDTV